MEQLDAHVLEQISARLSRKECVRWSWASRHCHAALQDLCDLRLTEAQAAVVRSIIAQDSITWGQWLHHYRHYVHEPIIKLPSQYSIASGPSTGKTAIALYAAAKLQRQGRPAFLAAPLKLCEQWRNEHAKFARTLNLPPLCIVHPRFTTASEWPKQLAEGALPLIPTSLLATTSNEWLKSFLQMRWEVALIDEAMNLPRSLFAYSVKALDALQNFHVIALNASRGGNTMAQHRADDALGQLPRVRVTVQHQPYSFTTQARKDWVSSVSAFVRQHMGRKTLVVTDDIVHRDGNAYNFLAVAELAIGPHINAARVDNVERSRAVQQFASAEAGLLLAPLMYVQRGFNLCCDRVILLQSWRRSGSRSLLQLIGRVRRIESPFQLVELCVMQGMSVSPRDAVFYPMTLGTDLDTSELLRRTEWLSTALESARSVRTLVSGGYRLRCLYDEFGCRHGPAGWRRALADQWPAAERTIVQLSAARLVVQSA